MWFQKDKWCQRVKSIINEYKAKSLKYFNLCTWWKLVWFLAWNSTWKGAVWPFWLLFLFGFELFQMISEGGKKAPWWSSGWRVIYRWVLPIGIFSHLCTSFGSLAQMWHFMWLSSLQKCVLRLSQTTLVVSVAWCSASPLPSFDPLTSSSPTVIWTTQKFHKYPIWDVSVRLPPNGTIYGSLTRWYFWTSWVVAIFPQEFLTRALFGVSGMEAPRNQ